MYTKRTCRGSFQNTNDIQTTKLLLLAFILKCRDSSNNAEIWQKIQFHIVQKENNNFVRNCIFQLSDASRAKCT